MAAAKAEKECRRWRIWMRSGGAIHKKFLENNRVNYCIYIDMSVYLLHTHTHTHTHAYEPRITFKTHTHTDPDMQKTHTKVMILFFNQ